MKRAFFLVATLLTTACSGKAPIQADATAETLASVGDTFDAAQIAKDRTALEKLVADELVFIEGDGKRSDKAAFIAGWTDPQLTFDPIKIVDRTIKPLGPDAGIVGGEVVLRGKAGGRPFASHIRFADTFRRVKGQWVATHIQVTRMEAPNAE